MGIQLVSNDTVAPWNRKVILPVTRGLEAYFTFDTDTTRFNFNRAPNKPNAFIFGQPVAFPTHGRFKALADFIETQAFETEKVTIIALGRSPVALPDLMPTPDPRPVYASTFSGPSITPGISGTSFGVTLSNSSSILLNSTAARSNGSGGITTGQVNVADTPTDWGIRVLRTSSAEPTLVQNLTKGTKLIGAAVAKRALTANPFRIGSGRSNFTGGEVDISAIAIYSEALTDDEIMKVAEAFRARAQRFGISA